MNCPVCRVPMADIADTPGFHGQVWECQHCRRRWSPDHKSQLTGSMRSGPIISPPPSDEHLLRILLGVLERLEWSQEWSGDNYVCPKCARNESQGHESWCELGQAVARLHLRLSRST